MSKGPQLHTFYTFCRPQEDAKRKLDIGRFIARAEWVLKRKQKKSPASIARLLHQRLGVAIMVGVKKTWWVIRENPAGEEGPEDRHNRSSRDRRAHQGIHPETGKAGAVPETALDGGAGEVVEAKGIPLVQEVGPSFQPIMRTGWPGWPNNFFAARMDRVYVQRKPDKHVNVHIFNHAKKERDHAEKHSDLRKDEDGTDGSDAGA